MIALAIGYIIGAIILCIGLAVFVVFARVAWQAWQEDAGDSVLQSVAFLTLALLLIAIGVAILVV